MARYYASVQVAGKWTAIVPSGDDKTGFPTYRHATEEIAKMSGDGLMIDGVKIMLDLTSVDLTDRDEFLGFMAYDPVLRTMFEFARLGGMGGAPAPVDARRNLDLEMAQGALNGPGAVVDPSVLDEPGPRGRVTVYDGDRALASADVAEDGSVTLDVPPAQIASFGIDLKSPWHRPDGTWSCVKDGVTSPCGKCGPCLNEAEECDRVQMYLRGAGEAEIERYREAENWVMNVRKGPFCPHNVRPATACPTCRGDL